MGCSHASGCPLFPKLNASLRGWRDAYCDSETGWQQCARYVQSRSGTVPLTLLPNGKYAHTITRPAAVGAGGSALALDEQRLRFESLPRPVHDPDSDSPFEAAPVVQEAPARPVDEPHTPTPRAPAPAAPRPAAPPTPPAPTRPGWWTRLLTWMRGPA